MGIADKYCKEVSTAFNLVAVYLPGSRIKIGDIIKFDKQKLLTNKKGVFTKYSSLKAKEIRYKKEIANTMSDLMYSTKGSVKVSTKIFAENIAKTQVSFTSEGSVYFNALKCRNEAISDFALVKKELHDRLTQNENGLFLVTKLITAKRAIIMQSSMGKGSLSFEIDNKTINDIADIGVNVSSVKNHSMIIEAEKDVTVLMALYEIKVKKNAIKKETQIRSPRKTTLTMDINDEDVMVSKNSRKMTQVKRPAAKKAAAKKPAAKKAVAKKPISMRNSTRKYMNPKNQDIKKSLPRNIQIKDSRQVLGNGRFVLSNTEIDQIGMVAHKNRSTSRETNQVRFYKVNASKFYS